MGEGDSWPGSPCIWQGPTGGARGGARSGSAREKPSSIKVTPMEEDFGGWRGIKSSSADILWLFCTSLRLHASCYCRGFCQQRSEVVRYNVRQAGCVEMSLARAGKERNKNGEEK